MHTYVPNGDAIPVGHARPTAVSRVTAVQRWVFEIPVRNGKPTYVKRRLKLAFGGISR